MTITIVGLAVLTYVTICSRAASGTSMERYAPPQVAVDELLYTIMLWFSDSRMTQVSKDTWLISANEPSRQTWRSLSHLHVYLITYASNGSN